MFKVLGEDVLRKSVGVLHDESVAAGVPDHSVLVGRVLLELVALNSNLHLRCRRS